MRSGRGIPEIVLAGIVMMGIVFTAIAAIAAGQTATDAPSARQPGGGPPPVWAYIRVLAGRNCSPNLSTTQN